jgi:hypothetical protein
MAKLSGKWFFDYSLPKGYVAVEPQPINFVSNGTSYVKMSLCNDGLWLNDYYTSSTVSEVAYSNVDYDVSKNNWKNNNFRIVDFGTTPQEVSQKFYDAFTSIAKPVPSDLTNTEWNVPSGWSANAGYGKFDLRFSTYVSDMVGYNSYRALYIGYDVGRTGSTIIFPASANHCAYVNSSHDFGVNYFNSQDLNLLIVGGTDATNANLISWLCTYGDWTNYEKKITDLTGYTVTVPSGWSATAGYGKFKINGRGGELINYESFVSLDIGYGLSGNEYDNKVRFSAWYISTGSSLIFTVTSGKDATNPSLIQWLYDNNATFDKAETQTLIVINSNNTSQTATFTMTKGVDFDEYIENFNTEFDVLYNDNYGALVTYKGVFITDSNGDYIYDTDVASGTFYYEGEEQPDTPEQPTTPHGEIYYKGNLVATIVEGETIVLHTKDFKFLGDIVIKNVVGNLKSVTFTNSYDGENSAGDFTIIVVFGKEITTWQSLVDSVYNSDTYNELTFDIGREGDWNEGQVMATSKEMLRNSAVQYNGVNVAPTETIVVNGEYTVSFGGGMHGGGTN